MAEKIKDSRGSCQHADPMPAWEKIAALDIQLRQGQEHGLKVNGNKVQAENAELLGVADNHSSAVNGCVSEIEEIPETQVVIVKQKAHRCNHREC